MSTSPGFSSSSSPVYCIQKRHSLHSTNPTRIPCPSGDQGKEAGLHPWLFIYLVHSNVNKILEVPGRCPVDSLEEVWARILGPGM